jgi:stress-induced morphogen
MNNLEAIKDIIQAKIQDAKVEVFDMTGGQDHLALLIASDEFIGKGLLDQHRIVMDVLKDELKASLHAVKLKTLTLEQYAQRNSV